MQAKERSAFINANRIEFIDRVNEYCGQSPTRYELSSRNSSLIRRMAIQRPENDFASTCRGLSVVYCTANPIISIDASVVL